MLSLDNDVVRKRVPEPTVSQIGGASDDDDDDDDINLRPGNVSSNLPKGIGTC
jgi:hypothetical protein